MALLSALLTGRVNLEIEVQVRALDSSTMSAVVLPLEFSWRWPVWISCSPRNHLSLAGGLAPIVMHSSSRSSPRGTVNALIRSKHDCLQVANQITMSDFEFVCRLLLDYNVTIHIMY